MSIFNIFKSAKVVDDVFDKDKGLMTQVGNWIGGMNYTEEEKAEAVSDVNKGVAEFVKSSLAESTVRSITRRAIAVLWIRVQLLFFIFSGVAAPFNLELAKFYLTIATADVMLFGTLSIIAFFFGSYMINQRLGTNKVQK